MQIENSSLISLPDVKSPCYLKTYCKLKIGMYSMVFLEITLIENLQNF